MATRPRTTARRAGQPTAAEPCQGDPPRAREVARWQGVFDTLRAAHRIDIDFLSDWDANAAFAEQVGVPYVAALLAEWAKVLDVDDIVEFDRWPGKEAWLVFCRRAAAGTDQAT